LIAPVNAAVISATVNPAAGAAARAHRAAPAMRTPFGAFAIAECVLQPIVNTDSTAS